MPTHDLFGVSCNMEQSKLRPDSNNMEYPLTALLRQQNRKHEEEMEPVEGRGNVHASVFLAESAEVGEELRSDLTSSHAAESHAPLAPRWSACERDNKPDMHMLVQPKGALPKVDMHMPCNQKDLASPHAAASHASDALQMGACERGNKPAMPFSVMHMLVQPHDSLPMPKADLHMPCNQKNPQDSLPHTLSRNQTLADQICTLASAGKPALTSPHAAACPDAHGLGARERKQQPDMSFLASASKPALTIPHDPDAQGLGARERNHKPDLVQPLQTLPSSFSRKQTVADQVGLLTSLESFPPLTHAYPFSSDSCPSTKVPSVITLPQTSTKHTSPTISHAASDIGQPSSSETKSIRHTPSPVLSSNPQKTIPSTQPQNSSIPSGKPKSWSNILQNSGIRQKLKFVAPLLNKDGILTLGEGMSKEGEAMWQHTIVGYSIERRLPFNTLVQRAMQLWGKAGLKGVRVTKEGFYLFSFKDKEGVDHVLEKGPWVILGQQIFLKVWSRNFEFRKEEFKTITNWVKLYGIPTTYWSISGLSTIASKIGVPLYADEITSEASILEFARICVEMQVGSSFPNSFKVLTEHNETFEVRVEYSWRPKQCSTCNVFGHRNQDCPKNVGDHSASNADGTSRTVYSKPSPTISNKLPFKPVTTSKHHLKQHTETSISPKQKDPIIPTTILPQTTKPEPCIKTSFLNKFSPLSSKEGMVDIDLDNQTNKRMANTPTINQPLSELLPGINPGGTKKFLHLSFAEGVSDMISNSGKRTSRSLDGEKELSCSGDQMDSEVGFSCKEISLAAI